MPQGYGWIFPMAPNQLKVGVIRYFQNKNYVPFEPSYQHYLNQLLAECGPYQLEDRHGKTIHYTARQKDKRYSGPVIAIGDAVSCVNPLGWEGIRHALFSGKAAAKSLTHCLSNKNSDFTSYQKELNRYFGYKWIFSEWFMKNLFTTHNDALIDKAVKHFGHMNNEEIIDVIFNYKFTRTIKSFFCYYLEKFGILSK
jgi:digeranylgeranylglycerophospholipid reductase